MTPQPSGVALVTGGRIGIGLAVAQRLAHDGYRVAICARDEDALTAAADDIEGEVLAIPADITDPADVDRLVEAVIDEYGGLGVLVNNAAITRGYTSFEDLTSDDWRALFEVNVFGTVGVTRTALPHLRRTDGGAIVNIASDFGVQPEPIMPAYSATKAAVLNITKSLSKECGPDGIRVNAVSPGITKSPKIARKFAQSAEEAGITPEEAEEAFVREERNIVLGRACSPTEVANVVSFLASDDASFVTGANYRVDGGNIAVIG